MLRRHEAGIIQLVEHSTLPVRFGETGCYQIGLAA
jgi:hypothetical protein